MHGRFGAKRRGGLRKGGFVFGCKDVAKYVREERAREGHPHPELRNGQVEASEATIRVWVGPPPRPPPPDDYWIVHHKNDIHTDNDAGNLEWMLNSEHSRMHR